jgi:hypothetical protein
MSFFDRIRRKPRPGPRVANLVCLRGLTETIGEVTMPNDTDEHLRAEAASDDTLVRAMKAAEGDPQPLPERRPKVPLNGNTAAEASAREAIRLEQSRLTAKAWVISSWLLWIKAHRGEGFTLGYLDVQALEQMLKGHEQVPHEDPPT